MTGMARERYIGDVLREMLDERLSALWRLKVEIRTLHTALRLIGEPPPKLPADIAETTP